MSFIDRSPNWLITFNIKSNSIDKFIQKSLISTQILISSLKKYKSNLSNKKG